MGNGAESEKGKRVKHHTTLQLTVYDGPAEWAVCGSQKQGEGMFLVCSFWSIPSLAGGRSLDASFWADVHVNINLTTIDCIRLTILTDTSEQEGAVVLYWPYTPTIHNTIRG
jgi:hypothetical protein